MTYRHRRINRRALLTYTAAATIAGPAVVRAADPVKIGLLAPLSGALAMVGQTNRNCLTLALEEINAAGGMLGRKVEMVAEDSQMSTKVTVDKARKLITADGVVALTGTVLPSEREAALQVAASAQRLVIHPNNDEGRCHANLLTTGLANNQSTDAAIAWLAKNVGKRLYFISSDVGTSRSVVEPGIKASLAKAGGTLVGAQYFPFGTRDFGPGLQKVKDENPDAVVHLIGDDPITFVKQYRSFGLKPALMSPIAHESINAACDGAAVGTLAVTNYFMSLDNAANRKFLDTYSARYADFTPRRVGGKVAMLPHGQDTYAGARILAEAARLAGSLELAKLKAALPGVSLDLPTGPVKVAPGGTHLLTPTYIGRAREDHTFDVLADLGAMPPTCG